MSDESIPARADAVAGSQYAESLTLAEYQPGLAAVLSDATRWPTATAAALADLETWRGHPHAPSWTHATGDRLSPEQVDRVLTPLAVDGWLGDHLDTARQLIYYRDLEGLDALADFPRVSRADLVRDVSQFVPLDADLSRLVEGSSSGSTGAALVVPDDVEDLARTFHLLVSLVRAEGIDWQPDPRRLALAYVVHQRDAFTYASVISSFGQRPMARVNLDPRTWADVASRAEFLADANPQVISGDPASLEALLDADLRGAVKPLAVFSGAAALTAPLRAALAAAFDCPVFDIYGLHETRPIAVRTDDGPFRVLDRRVHVEILDEAGLPVSPGEVGEIVVTSGENQLLPLVRYRSGDFARLVALPGDGIGLADLQGRENVTFISGAGAAVASLDLTQHLQAHGALGWSVEQGPDGATMARIVGGDRAAIATALRNLLDGVDIEVVEVATIRDLGPGKPRQYRTSC